MKILWCDDLASDPAAVEAFRAEWGQTMTPERVVPVTNDVDAMEALTTDSEIRLLVLDLLWDSQPEDPSVQPMGLLYLRRIRSRFPHLHTVTRSIAESITAFAGWLSDIIELDVRDHFVSGDTSAHGQLRRRLLLESLQRDTAQRSSAGVSADIGELDDPSEIQNDDVDPVLEGGQLARADHLRITAWPSALLAVQRYADARHNEAKGKRGMWFESLHPKKVINSAAPFPQLPAVWEVVRKVDTISSEVYPDEYGNDLTQDVWRLGNHLVLGFDKSADGDENRLQALIRLFFFHEYLHTYHSLTKYTAEEVGKFANCLERIDYGADLYALLHQVDFLVRRTELPAGDPAALRAALVDQIDLILRSFWAFEPAGQSLNRWQVRRLRRYLNWYWRRAQLQRTEDLQICYRVLARPPTIELVGLKQEVIGRRHYMLLNRLDERTDLELGLVMEDERMLRIPNSGSSRVGELVEAFRSRDHDRIGILMQRVFEAAGERRGALPVS